MDTNLGLFLEEADEASLWFQGRNADLTNQSCCNQRPAKEAERAHGGLPSIEAEDDDRAQGNSWKDVLHCHWRVPGRGSDREDNLGWPWRGAVSEACDSGARERESAGDCCGDTGQA
ncbi:hypothetical protein LINPERPRIM_LOCUS18469 [Linum perenne]